MIPYGRQDISQADIDAVVEVLRSDFLTQGPMVPRFEQAVADYGGARYAVAVNSATSALHIACLALGVGPGDRVWTSPITFVASANCARYCGADVDFVDIDPGTYNLCPAALGLSQLQRLDAFVARRHELAARYDEALQDLPLVTPWRHPDGYSGFHLYLIRLKLDEIGKTHRQVFEALRAAGIGVNLHYIPVYRQPYHARMGFDPADFPESERYYAEAISLPLYPGLTDRAQRTVIEALQWALGCIRAPCS